MAPVAASSAATAAPQVSVTAVILESTQPVILYLPAKLASESLGFPSSALLEARARRADGSAGGVLWVDRSAGHLSISPTGLVEVPATASPGLHLVRAQALHDPNVFQDVLVEVRSTGQLDMLVQ